MVQALGTFQTFHMGVIAKRLRSGLYSTSQVRPVRTKCRRLGSNLRWRLLEPMAHLAGDRHQGTTRREDVALYPQLAVLLEKRVSSSPPRLVGPSSLTPRSIAARFSHLAVALAQGSDSRAGLSTVPPAVPMQRSDPFNSQGSEPSFSACRHLPAIARSCPRNRGKSGDGSRGSVGLRGLSVDGPAAENGSRRVRDNAGARGDATASARRTNAIPADGDRGSACPAVDRQAARSGDRPNRAPPSQPPRRGSMRPGASAIGREILAVATGAEVLLASLGTQDDGVDALVAGVVLGLLLRGEV